MRPVLGPVLGAILIIAAPASAAAAQAAVPAQSNDAAKLIEARAVIGIMFPPAQRQSMFDKLQTDMMAQLRPSFPASVMADPGLRAIIEDFIQRSMALQRPTLQKHLPDMLEGMAAAY